jgi:hypothetical protein
LNSTDTILSQNAAYIANEMNSFLSVLFRTSPVFSFAVHAALGFAFLSAAKSIQKREISSYLPIFTLFFFLCLPSGDQLMYGRIARTIEKVIDSVLGSFDKKMAERFSENMQLPPGYVYKMIDKAVNARIDNKLVKDMVRESIISCVPYGKRYDGKDISSRDLFEVQTIGSGNDTTNGIIFKNFDGAILKNRTFLSNSTGNDRPVTCYEHVTATVFALRKRLKNQLGYEDVADFSANENIANLVHDLNEKSKGSEVRQNIDKVALNIAQANAIKSYIYKKNNPNADQSFSKDYVGIEYSDQLKSSTLGGIYLTASNFISATKRAYNVDGYGDAVGKLTELNERVNNLPYTIVSIKNILWFCAPIALFALICNLPVVLWVWLGAWIGICIVPHAMFFLRIHSNMAINSALKLTDPISLAEYSSNRLIQEVALTSVKQALADSSVAISQLVNTEFFVLGGFMTILPGIGFLASSKASKGFMGQMGSYASQAAVGTLTRSGIHSVMNSSTQNISTATETLGVGAGDLAIGAASGGIGSTVAAGASTLVSSDLSNKGNNQEVTNLYAFNDDVDSEHIISQ